MLLNSFNTPNVFTRFDLTISSLQGLTVWALHLHLWLKIDVCVNRKMHLGAHMQIKLFPAGI